MAINYELPGECSFAEASIVRVIYNDVPEDIYPVDGIGACSVGLHSGLLRIGTAGYNLFMFHPLSAVRKLWRDGATAIIELQ